MNSCVLLDLHYLPSLEYFCALMRYDHIKLEAQEHFVKQTFRNRCHILAANKVDKLSIPVLGAQKKLKVKDIRIDYSQRWVKDHWRAITSAYGRAPFFEFFADYFDPIFHKREEFLFDLNRKFLTLCLKLLQVDMMVSLTESYEKRPSKPDLDDLRGVIHPKKSYEVNSFYEPVVYPQVFGNNFAANMSIIDLLFCEGPNAKLVVTNSIKGRMNK